MNTFLLLFSFINISYSYSIIEDNNTIPSTNTTLCNCNVSLYENTILSIFLITLGSLFLSFYSISISWRSYRRRDYTIIQN